MKRDLEALAVRLDSKSVEAVAQRIAELLRHGPEPAPARPNGAELLLTAPEVAHRTGRSVDWVRAHAEDLGVRRIGSGEKPRLYFSPVRVEEALGGEDSTAPPTTATPSTTIRRRSPPPTALLPVRGRP